MEKNKRNKKWLCTSCYWIFVKILENSSPRSRQIDVKKKKIDKKKQTDVKNSVKHM